MVVPKIQSAHNSEARNIINKVIEVLNVHGKTIQDLVADGQLTPAQYAELIEIVNGNVKSGEVDKFALTPELRTEVEKIQNKIDKGEVSVSDINKNKGKLDQTYLTDELLQQMTGDSPINATPADFGVTKEKMAEKSVSTEKTDFIIHSDNLFDRNKIIPDTRIDAQTGEVLYNTTSFTTSEMIPIKPETIYTVTDVNRKSYYDRNGGFIVSDTVSGTFTSPENAFYMRVSFVKGTQDTVQLNEGDVLLEYDEFRKSLSPEVKVDTLPKNSVTGENIIDGVVGAKKTDFLIQSSNLFNKETVTYGNVIDFDGALSNNSNYAISDHIDVYENTTYTMTPTHSIAIYDGDGEFMERLSGTTSNEPVTITTPVETATIRLNLNMNSSYVNVDDTQVNLGDTLLPYEEYGYSLSSDIKLNNGSGQGGVDFKDRDHYVINGALDGYYHQEEPLPARTYMLHDVIYGFYDDLMAAHPNYITREEIGRSVNDLPIYRYDFKLNEVQSPETKTPKMLIVSGTHGPEKMAVDVLKHTMAAITERWKEDDFLETLRWNVDFVIIPLLNPDGWDAHERKNMNGIDLNRQFPADWYQSTPDANDYGGTEPLTEPEAIALKNVIDSELENLIYICDFHNFSTRPEGDREHEMIWIVGETAFNINLAETLIRTVSQKWKRKYTFMPQDDTTSFGYVSDYVGGTIARYGVSLGVQSSVYECSQAITVYNPEDGNYGPLAMQMFTEAYINWLILNLRNNIRIS